MGKGQRIGYVRVSSVDQATERQLDGVDLDRTYTDKASGKDTKRPQLALALAHLRDGDTLVVHSMDRLARNTEDLLRLVRELNERGVVVEFRKEKLTFAGTTDPIGELMMTVLAGIAKFERSLIRERQREGIAIAKAKGVYKGRKKSLAPESARELVELARSGIPKADLARSYGISRETVYAYLRGGN
ncbi:MAG: recombinase family protein [Betaproteobacteria bacterium]